MRFIASTDLKSDARNQLSAVTGTGLNASFQYDSRGQRVGKTVNGTTINFLYNGANTVQEQSAQTGTANILSGGIDEFFLRTDSSGTWSPLLDSLGSSVSLTDATGATQTEYAYGAFGQSATSGADTDNSAQYTGRENDGTGLQYNRARYYSSTLQRFISEDPLEFGGGDVNLYGYTANSPTNFTDPSGMAIDGIRARMRNLASRKLNVDYILGFAANYAAGLGDRFGKMCLPLPLVFLGVNPVGAIRDLTPGGATIDYNSGAYGSGGDSATIVTFVLSAGAGGGGAGGAGATQEGTTLYRGVANSPRAQFGDALNGIARPIGGHADPALHNLGNTASEFTSWTTSRSVAVRFAGQDGVVLQRTFAGGMTQSEDIYWESEVLIRGIVTGARVTRP